jgi:NAD(P) transhydrogenase subunit beta
MTDYLKYAIDLVAVLLLALGIKGLSKVRSARGANQLAAVAMGLAVIGLLVNYVGVPTFNPKLGLGSLAEASSVVFSA